MAADIELSGEQVKVTAWDLCLDGGADRNTTGGQKRAIVHDYDDGLTLNWDIDYPGGVTIDGPVKLLGDVVHSGDVTFTFQWDAAHAVPEPEDDVGAAFWIPWPQGKPTEMQLDQLAVVVTSRLAGVAGALHGLMAENADLRHRIAALEDKVGGPA